MRPAVSTTDIDAIVGRIHGPRLGVNFVYMISSEALQTAGLRADPAADAAVEALSSALVPGVDPWQVLCASDHPAALALKTEILRPPEDLPQIVRATRWALRYAPAVGVVLATRSLLSLYAVPEIARVLTATGRLTGRAERRTLETARFLFEIGKPESYVAGGAACASIGRVRLLHAVTRRRIADSWIGAGPPIDQRSLLFTLCVFSGGVRAGMTELGVRLPEDEAQDHLGLWRHIGTRLGVEPALIAARPAEERECFTALQQEICHASPEGRALARALLSGLAARPPYLLPEGALVALSRAMLGERISEILDLPPRPRWAAVQIQSLGPLRLLDQAGRRSPALLSFAERFGRLYAGGMLRWRLSGDADYESLPEADGKAAAR